jgi:CheY-like chemotaxis protein
LTEDEKKMPHILIVDDEASIREALYRWFTLRGFQVEQAQDGLEAIEICKLKRFDAITMDVEMPRMNGLDAIPIIKNEHPDTAILVLTGFAKNLHKARELGAAIVMTKPVRLRELEQEVRKLIPHFVPSSPEN